MDGLHLPSPPRFTFLPHPGSPSSPTQAHLSLEVLCPLLFALLPSLLGNSTLKKYYLALNLSAISISSSYKIIIIMNIYTGKPFSARVPVLLSQGSCLNNTSKFFWQLKLYMLPSFYMLLKIPGVLEPFSLIQNTKYSHKISTSTSDQHHHVYFAIWRTIFWS